MCDTVIAKLSLALDGLHGCMRSIGSPDSYKVCRAGGCRPHVSFTVKEMRVYEVKLLYPTSQGSYVVL